jgi:hypothetical protein
MAADKKRDKPERGFFPPVVDEQTRAEQTTAKLVAEGGMKRPKGLADLVDWDESRRRSK